MAKRPHERRATGETTYYRLATWQPRSFSYKDSPKVYETQEAAKAAARKPGKYRICRVEVDGATTVAEDFEV